MTDKYRITMAKKLFGYEKHFWKLRNNALALKLRNDETAYHEAVAELGIAAENILCLCKAYADTFAHGFLAVGLDNLQELCDWIAEQGQEAEKKTPLPATQQELADFLAGLVQTAFVKDNDGQESYLGYAEAPKVRLVYCTAYLQWQSCKERRKAKTKAEAES